ncbi:hypothetical protein FIBSPDRAFT_890345 [Athelia psychrophila]|uniref:Uncharacterized protein n=1 Tax=Athelia psychrophila TaxID=1759441 RepID=A0A166L0U9_9AGAM|nr:hypothetical protein FIBSPDRAFT_890345 [Fibularhizoctonia sp. CBS 109695]
MPVPRPKPRRMTAESAAKHIVEMEPPHLNIENSVPTSDAPEEHILPGEVLVPSLKRPSRDDLDGETERKSKKRAPRPPAEPLPLRRSSRKANKEVLGDEG